MDNGARESFNAPSEVVFGTMTDPERVQRWLPPQVLAQAPRHRVEIDPDAMRVTVRPLNGTGWSGHVAVRDSDAGASEVEVDLSGETVGEGERARADELIRQALRALRSDVDDNFTTG